MLYVAICWCFHSFFLEKKGPTVKGPFSQRALDTKFILDTMYFRSGKRLELVSESSDQYSRHKQHFKVQRALKGPFSAKMEISLRKYGCLCLKSTQHPRKPLDWYLTCHIWTPFGVLMAFYKAKKGPNFEGPFLPRGTLKDFVLFTQS